MGNANARKALSLDDGNVYVNMLSVIAGSGTFDDPYTGHEDIVTLDGKRYIYGAGYYAGNRHITGDVHGFTIQGQGTDTVFLGTTADAPIRIGRTEDYVDAVMPTRWQLKDFRVDGVGVADCGVDIVNAHFARANKNVLVNNTITYGIRTRWAVCVPWESCQVSENSGYGSCPEFGFYFDENADLGFVAATTAALVKDCLADHCSGAGIVLASTSGMTITGGAVAACGQGIRIDADSESYDISGVNTETNELYANGKYFRIPLAVNYGGDITVGPDAQRGQITMNATGGDNVLIDPAATKIECWGFRPAQGYNESEVNIFSAPASGTNANNALAGLSECVNITYGGDTSRTRNALDDDTADAIHVLAARDGTNVVRLIQTASDNRHTAGTKRGAFVAVVPQHSGFWVADATGAQIFGVTTNGASLSAMTIGTLTLGADTWHKSNDGQDRFHFASGAGHNYYRTAPGGMHIWRNFEQTNIMTLTEGGALSLPFAAATFGNGLTVSAGGATVAAGGITATIGDITATSGDLVAQGNGGGGTTYRFTVNASNALGPRLQLGQPSTPAALFELGAYNNRNNFDSKARDLYLFNTGGAGVFLANSTGFVGVGTTSPATKFDVFGGTLTYSANSSTSTKRSQVDVVPSWIDSTDATRKARVTFSVYDTAAREFMRADATGFGPRIGLLGTVYGNSAVTIRPASTDTDSGLAMKLPASSGPSSFFSGYSSSDVQLFTITAAGDFIHNGTYAQRLASSTSTLRNTCQVISSWADSTDASRKARVQHYAIDAGGSREYIRGEASGSAPMLGFYGSSAVAKQTITGSRGGNAALADLLTKLATLGLITDSTSA
jgi:hypothetical protein